MQGKLIFVISLVSVFAGCIPKKRSPDSDLDALRRAETAKAEVLPLRDAGSLKLSQ